MSAQSKMQFLKWLEKRDPAVFDLAMKRFQIKQGETALHGMGAINWGSIGENITGFFNTAAETVKNVLPTVIQYKAQSKVLDSQLKRAEQGLPPLNVADYSPVMTINPRIDPASEAALTRIAVQSTSTGVEKIMPWALGGLGLVMLMMTMRGGRSRRR